MAINIEYVVPTWGQVYDMLLDQAQKVRSQGFKPDVVVGVARGGVVSARILVDLLEVSQVASIQVERYTGIAAANDEPTLKQALPLPIGGKKILLVDDIADSGRCLKFAENYLKQQGAAQIKSATLYYKPSSIVVPDFYEKQTCNWVVFPWETKETLRKLIQRHAGKRALNQEIAKLVKAGLPKQLAEKLLATME